MLGLGLGLSLGRRSPASATRIPMRYLFIDGGFLDAMLLKTKEYFSLDLDLAYRFERITAGFSRSFYYDAYPSRKTDQSTEQFDRLVRIKSEKFRTINLTPNVHTREGLTRSSVHGARLRQKGVDILLAIDVYKHAINGNIDEAHIMATDLDFFPLLEALRDTRVSNYLHCYKKETSEDLMFLADRIMPVNPFVIAEWCGHDTSNYVRVMAFDEEMMTELVREGTCQGGYFRVYRFEYNGAERYAGVGEFNRNTAYVASREELIVDYIEKSNPGYHLVYF